MGLARRWARCAAPPRAARAGAPTRPRWSPTLPRWWVRWWCGGAQGRAGPRPGAEPGGSAAGAASPPGLFLLGVLTAARIRTPRSLPLRGSGPTAHLGAGPATGRGAALAGVAWAGRWRVRAPGGLGCGERPEVSRPGGGKRARGHPETSSGASPVPDPLPTSGRCPAAGRSSAAAGHPLGRRARPGGLDSILQVLLPALAPTGFGARLLGVACAGSGHHPGAREIFPGAPLPVPAGPPPGPLRPGPRSAAPQPPGSPSCLCSPSSSPPPASAAPGSP